ncbi:hypothetical protein ACHAPD_004887 [Fusarium lateritium]
MDQTIPRITVTSPTGEQVPVLVFPFPAQATQVQPWEWFADQFEPEPEPEAEPKDPSFALADEEAKQQFEDQMYSHLPACLAEFKSKRVPVDEFVPICCRFCGKTFFDRDGLKRHLGRKPGNGKFTLRCRAAKDPNSVDDEAGRDDGVDEPPKKKQRVAKD